MSRIILSELGHTWLLDLDGTVVIHNGYKDEGEDRFLPGAEAFLKSIPDKDRIIFLTSRKEAFRAQTETFLAAHGIRYDAILFELPYGERILINDCKPSGLNVSVALNTQRDEWCELSVVEDPDL